MKKIVQVVLVMVALFLGGVPTQARAQDKPWAIDEMVGKADAPITIVEYSSLTCPHCAHFHIDTFPQLKTDWIDTGKAKLIYRDFPWDPLAQAAAMVAHCSGDRYFAFVSTFFHTQDQWAHSQEPLTAIKGIAKLGGMNENQVDKCLQDRGLLNEINARKDDGEKRYGIESTPSFIINGKLYAGALPYDQLGKILTDLAK